MIAILGPQYVSVTHIKENRFHLLCQIKDFAIKVSSPLH
jgi:hypothetical protein